MQETRLAIDKGFASRWFAEWEPEDPLFGEATRHLVHLIDHEPEAAWSHVLRLISEAPSESLLNCIGAGPLEDLLCQHAPQFIDRVEQQSDSDERFRRCLCYMWGETQINPTIYARILSAREKT